MAPAGIRMKVCSASQTESKPGILSARNSITSNAPVTSRYGAGTVYVPVGHNGVVVPPYGGRTIYEQR